jgi:general secretion pathway protein G
VAPERLKPNKRRADRGLTLIELLVILGLIGILSTISGAVYVKHLHNARYERACIEIRMIATEIETYQVEFRKCPDSLEEIGMARLDPWGNPYRYLNFADATVGQMRKDQFMVPINSDYDLYSMGRDGQTREPLVAPVSHDDVIRADDGTFIGYAIDY